MKYIVLYLSILIFSSNLFAQESIYEILDLSKCQEVSIKSHPKIYVGDDLFNLINGGAELYHEFGFVEVLAAEYAAESKNIKIEVYDMGSTQSAWGIYSLTSTSNARRVDIGDIGREGQGFMQFVKAKYMIYAYAEDDNDEVLIKTLGCIAQNIKTSSAPPALYKTITSYKEEGKHVYFKGNLGLSSIYNFHYKDIFGYEEGVACVSEDNTVVVLAYADKDVCNKKFNSSFEFFSNSKKYHDQVFADVSYQLRDRKDQYLDFFLLDKYVVIFIHDGSLNTEYDKERLMELF